MIYAFDVETCDPGLKTHGPGWAFRPVRGYVVGYALAWREGAEVRSLYLPVRHEGGGNRLEAEARAILAPILADPSNTIVMANAGYDYGWALAEGFEWNAALEDVQVYGPLLDEQRMSYSLDNLAKDALGVGKDETALYAAAKEWGIKDVKANLWRLPAPDVEPYARQDAEVTLRLAEVQRPRIAEEGLETVAQLEHDLIPLLYRMRRKGVRVDVERAEREAARLRGVEETLGAEAEALAGVPIDPWASARIVEVLKAEGVSDFPLTPKKGEPSVTADFLRSLADHDNRAGHLAKLIGEMRRWQKVRSTFLENMILGHAVDGRIHCQLHALRSDDGGTVSGRFSASMPNLQQVPARDPEVGPLIRRLFLPDDGQWCSIDYSSQEPRIATHIGEAAGIRGAAEAAQRYRDDPRADPYLHTAEVCGISRKQAKAIRLGILYGMGGGKLCESLGLPTVEGDWKGRKVLYAGDEGKRLLAAFDEASPMDRKLADLASRRAKGRGYIKTLLGRRARFPRRPNGEVWFTHKALNRAVQGGAADMMKTAMMKCAREIQDPLLTIHDELAFDVPDRATAEALAEAMSTALPLSVPVVCDIEMGDSWGASMEGAA